jgi:hypothetical protein
MTRSPWPRKTPVNLSESISRQLNTYAIAAGAAGVGILALAQPAEAKIVFTPTWQQVLPRSSVKLDLNNDGVTDFQLLNTRLHSIEFSSRTFLSTMKVLPKNQGNAIWGTGRSASLLTSGVTIGPAGRCNPAIN